MREPGDFFDLEDETSSFLDRRFHIPGSSLLSGGVDALSSLVSEKLFHDRNEAVVPQERLEHLVDIGDHHTLHHVLS